MTISEELRGRLLAIPGVLAVTPLIRRVLIKTPARDFFPVRRRVEAWIALYGVDYFAVCWELWDGPPSGGYDSMERAISSSTYRSSDVRGYPAASNAA
jgi:hypothetical protein